MGPHIAPTSARGLSGCISSFKEGLAADYTVFATGFAGGMTSPEGAVHRPVGLALGGDGSLFLSDDKGGRIWRVTYKAK
jgi:glucose/arabinose dehydrogenase